MGICASDEGGGAAAATGAQLSSIPIVEPEQAPSGSCIDTGASFREGSFFSCTSRRRSDHHLQRTTHIVFFSCTSLHDAHRFAMGACASSTQGKWSAS